MTGRREQSSSSKIFYLPKKSSSHSRTSVQHKTWFLSYCIGVLRAIGLMSRVFAHGPVDQGSIPGRVIPKTQKIVLDANLLNKHYKVRMKGKVEQSREWSSALPYTFGVVAIEKGAFGSPTSFFTVNLIFCFIFGTHLTKHTENNLRLLSRIRILRLKYEPNVYARFQDYRGMTGFQSELPSCPPPKKPQTNKQISSINLLLDLIFW